MEFIPYKSNETLENRYYQIPQELFENSLYKDKLTSDSKILYAFITVFSDTPNLFWRTLKLLK